MKKLLFLLISIIIIACGDNSTQFSDTPSSSNITFTPESMVLKPVQDTMLFVFRGVDFSKHYIEKICFGNNKLMLNEVTKEYYVARLTHRNTGEFDVNIYFKSGLITLDKRVSIYPSDYELPDVKRITFSPTNMIITSDNQSMKLVFKGIDFSKTYFDSILVNDLSIMISTRYKDSLVTYIPKLLNGTFDINMFYKGFKFNLMKKLEIKNQLFDFNFLKNITCNLSISNIKVRQMEIWTLIQGQKTDTGSSFKDYNYSSTMKDLQLSESDKVSLDTYEYYEGNPQHYTKMRIVFNDEYSKIALLEFQSQKIEFLNDVYRTQGLTLILENLDFLIIQENLKRKFVIDIKGKNLNKTYFNINSYYNVDDAFGSVKEFRKQYFLTTKDPSTNRVVNFYPATDSSSIKFEIY